MSKHVMRIVLFTMTLSFVAYSEEVKTVNYYKQHISERKAKIEECKNNPGELKGTPNCVNAITAHRTGGIKPNPNLATDAKQFDKF